MVRESIPDGVVGRGGFKNWAALGFQPGVAGEDVARFFSQAEYYLCPRAAVREIPVKDGRAFPASRREAEHVEGEE